MADYVRALNGVRMQLETHRHPSPGVPPDADSTGIIRELELTCDTFEQKLSEQSRHMSWVSHNTAVNSKPIPLKQSVEFGNLLNT